jgi:hypothetical protein
MIISLAHQGGHHLAGSEQSRWTRPFQYPTPRPTIGVPSRWRPRIQNAVRVLFDRFAERLELEPISCESALAYQTLLSKLGSFGQIPPSEEFELLIFTSSATGAATLCPRRAA